MFILEILFEYIIGCILYVMVDLTFKGIGVAFAMIYLFIRYRDRKIRDAALHKFYYGTYLGPGSITVVKTIGTIWLLILVVFCTVVFRGFR